MRKVHSFLSVFVTFAVISSNICALNLNEMCRGRLFESLPHPTNANLFIGCVQNKGTLLGCDKPEEIFDPFLVSCVDGGVPVDPENEATCENVIFGLFPVSDNCREYLVCQESRPHLTSCPENSVFNKFLPGCVPGNSTSCEFDFHTTPAPTTETTTPIAGTNTEETTTNSWPSTTTARTTTPGYGFYSDF